MSANITMFNENSFLERTSLNLNEYMFLKLIYILEWI